MGLYTADIEDLSGIEIETHDDYRDDVGACGRLPEI